MWACLSDTVTEAVSGGYISYKNGGPRFRDIDFGGRAIKRVDFKRLTAKKLSSGATKSAIDRTMLIFYCRAKDNDSDHKWPFRDAG
jgi:hypothetical protein